MLCEQTVTHKIVSLASSFMAYLPVFIHLMGSKLFKILTSLELFKIFISFLPNEMPQSSFCQGSLLHFPLHNNDVRFPVCSGAFVAE